MFGSPFSRDYSRRTPMPSAYVYPSYSAPNQTAYHPQHTYDAPRQHRHTPRQHPQPQYRSPPPQHHRRLPRRPSHYSDISPSPSEHDSRDEIRPYYMMPSGDPHANIPHEFRPRRNHSPPPPSPSPPPSTNTTSLFRPFHARVTPRAAQKLGKDEILILPHMLTRLRVQMRSRDGNETLRVNVAGDMPLRDVIKQLLPESNWSDGTMVYVKMRGAWLEPGCALVSQIMEQGRFVLNERGEVEVKIEIGGGGRQTVRDV